MIHNAHLQAYFEHLWSYHAHTHTHRQTNTIFLFFHSYLLLSLQMDDFVVTFVALGSTLKFLKVLLTLNQRLKSECTL